MEVGASQQEDGGVGDSTQTQRRFVEAAESNVIDNDADSGGAAPTPSKTDPHSLAPVTEAANKDSGLAGPAPSGPPTSAPPIQLRTVAPREVIDMAKLDTF